MPSPCPVGRDEHRDSASQNHCVEVLERFPLLLTATVRHTRSAPSPQGGGERTEYVAPLCVNLIGKRSNARANGMAARSSGSAGAAASAEHRPKPGVFCRR